MTTVKFSAEIIYPTDVDDELLQARFRQLLQEAVFGTTPDALLSWDRTALDIVFVETEHAEEEKPKIWGSRYALADTAVGRLIMPNGEPVQIDGFWQAEGEDGLRCRVVQHNRTSPDDGYTFTILFKPESAVIQKVTCYDRKGRSVGTIMLPE